MWRQSMLPVEEWSFYRNEDYQFGDNSDIVGAIQLMRDQGIWPILHEFEAQIHLT